MKLKKVLAILGLTSVFALAACNSANNTTTTGGAPANTTTTQNNPSSGSTTVDDSTNYLSFLENKKGRIDLFGVEGVTFKYGDNNVVSGQVIDINESKVISVTGTATKDLNFVIVTKMGDTNTVIGNKAIIKDEIANYLNDVAADLYKSSDKFYIAISSGEVQWTKNLSKAMDDKIPQVIIA